MAWPLRMKTLSVDPPPSAVVLFGVLVIAQGYRGRGDHADFTNNRRNTHVGLDRANG
jgi:hypothetical protein